MSKGRVADEFLAGLQTAGIKVLQEDRSLWTQVPELDLSLLTVRNWDTPVVVANGVTDFGVVGFRYIDRMYGFGLLPTT